MDKKNVVYPHNGVLFRNEILIHAITWMNLENIILSERSQLEKGYILCNSGYSKFLEQANPQRYEVDQWFPGDGRREEWGVMKIFELDSGDANTPCEYTKNY